MLNFAGYWVAKNVGTTQVWTLLQMKNISLPGTTSGKLTKCKKAAIKNKISKDIANRTNICTNLIRLLISC